MPEFSVIIPTHNRGRFIREAVESVLAQTFTDFEIIVIDDGSTDDTPELLTCYAGRIRYTRQDRRGRSAARNRGIMLAQGRYCAFLDSDDTWFPDKLERQIVKLGDSPELGLLHGPVEVIDEEGNPMDDVTDCFRAGLARQQAKGETYEELLLHHTMYTSTTVVPRSVFDAVGMFDPALDPREDLDLYLRIALGYPIASLTGDPVCRYRTRREELADPPDLSQVYVRVHRKHLEILRANPPISGERQRKAFRNLYLAVARDHHAANDDAAARSYLTKALAADPPGALREPAFFHMAIRTFAPPFLLDRWRGLRARGRRRKDPRPGRCLSPARCKRRGRQSC